MNEVNEVNEVNVLNLTSAFSSELTKRQPLATRLLSNGLAQGKLAHAFLFTGRAVEDKYAVAGELFAYLNCQSTDDPAKRPCREKLCLSCKWQKSLEHPAWLDLSAGNATKSGKVSVESARALTDELIKTSSYTRMVIVADASEAIFHRPSANALLKTIEESKSKSFFAFFAQDADSVLPTVVSRCQVIPFQSSARTLEQELAQKREIVQAIESKKFFQTLADKRLYMDALSGEAVLSAQDLAQDVFALAEDKYSAEDIIDAMVLWESSKTLSGALSSKRQSKYLSQLNLLSDTCKRQIDSYVGKKAALETFMLSWLKLKNEACL